MTRLGCSISFLRLLGTLLITISLLPGCGELKITLVGERPIDQMNDSIDATLSSGLPQMAATSVSFNDVAPQGGILSGLIRISRATDERSITQYVVYWGSDEKTILKGSQPLGSLSKSISELDFKITTGQAKPNGATHFLIRTSNKNGEMKDGVSTLIVDKGVPEHSAVSVSFSDKNPTAGKLDGDIVISKASMEKDISHYALYWGNDRKLKLSPEPITTIAKTGANLKFTFPKATLLPQGASFLLVFTRNGDGEMATSISEKIIDFGAPENAATSITFTDEDTAVNKLAGRISISRAASEKDLTDYVIYWGMSPTTKLYSAPIASISKSNENLFYNVPAGTLKPGEATHFLVFTKNAMGEMALGVSAPIVDKGVPENAAVSVSFNDSVFTGGRLGGAVLISKALNELDLTHYVLYWGSNQNEKLNSTPIATLKKTGENLSYILESGTVKPTGATHFLVFTRFLDGEMATGVNVQIIDKGVPTNAAQSVLFSDTDSIVGDLGGTVTINKAVNESDVSQYVLYWGSSPTTKLFTNEIVKLDKKGSNLVYNLRNTIPRFATHLLVFTNNEYGEMASGASVAIVDKGVPLNKAASVSFTDENISVGTLDGNVTINKALNESDLTHYVLYWGSNSTSKLNPTPIANFPKTGSNLVYKFPSKTLKPSAATHLLVFTKFNDGEMPTGVGWQIIDKGVPLNTAGPVSFIDTDFAAGKLSGDISISKAASESDLTHYALYWGANATTKLSGTPLTVISKTNSNLVQKLEPGTSKPTGATHILVFTRFNDGEMATGVSTPIIDNAPPSNTAGTITFKDEDPAPGQLTGLLTISKAANESDVADYVVYWGSNPATKVNKTPIVTIPKTGSNLVYSISANTARPFGATHILVFTKNSYGEMAVAANVQISDLGLTEDCPEFCRLPVNSPGFKSLASNFLRGVTAIDNNIYAASSYGLSISVDGGVSWKTKTSAQGLSSDVVNDVVQADGVLYVATDDGISISNDRGKTWSKSAKSFSINRIFVSNGLIYASGRHILIILKDGGSKWHTSANIYGEVVATFANGNTIVAADASGLHKSTDGGVTWNNPSGLNGLGIKELTGNGNTLYAATGNNGLWVSLDSGETWMQKKIPVTVGGVNSDYANYVDAVTFNNGTIYAATGQGLAISKDNGNTWSKHKVTNNVVTEMWPKRISVIGGVIYTTGSEGIMMSSDSGVSWRNIRASSGEPYLVAHSVFASGSKIYVATDAGLSISSNGGLSWILRDNSHGIGANPAFGLLLRGVAASGNNVYVASRGGGVSVSNDGGNTWQARSTTHGLASQYVNKVAVSGNTVYAATDSGLSISTDAGLNWRTVTQKQGVPEFKISSVHVDGDLVYAASYGGGLYISKDRGITWTQRTTLHGLNYNYLVNVYASGDTIYVLYNWYGVSISKDGGTTWITKTKSNGLISEEVQTVFASGNTVYAGGNKGLSISTDGGDTWTNKATENGLPTDIVHDLYAVGSTVYVASPKGLSVMNPIVP